MFIQGNLQAVFDALYTVGAIDPVLKMDWKEINKEIVKNHQQMTETVKKINSCNGDENLLKMVLCSLDKTSLNFLAMEVAREFAEYQDNSVLH